MKKIILLVLLLLALSLCGCTKRQDKTSAKDQANTMQTTAVPGDVAANTETTVYPYTFIDSLGNSVTLEAPPQKVAVLFSSYADIWQTAGGEVAVTVGDSIERGFASESCLIVDEGSGHTVIDTELLVASEPDLVIGTTDYEVQREAVKLCADNGIPAAVFQVETFGDYLSMLEICTQITGQPELYQKHGIEIGEKIKALLADIETLQTDIESHTTDNIGASEAAARKSILLVRAGSSDRSTKAKTASDHFVCAMLNELKTYNIAESAPVLLDGLSIEEIMIADPDHIFITTMGDESAAREHMNSVLGSAGWKDLTAVKQNTYTYLPKELFHYKPNSRWYEAYQYLAEILYPELQFD